MILHKSFFWTTLLDLICCGLGAAIVLLMISASTISIDPPPAATKSLVVRSIPINDSQRAEVGIEYRSPNSDVWKSEADTPSLRFSAGSNSSSEGQAFLILMHPEPGTWQFRPYLRDFPRASASSKPVTGVTVSLDVWGDYPVISRTPPTAKMGLPGDPGPIVDVRIPDSNRGK